MQYSFKLLIRVLSNDFNLGYYKNQVTLQWVVHLVVVPGNYTHQP